ncbi:MAG: RNA polymerase sigma factor [Agitococcus sp.]|nr:RNA polymerase sigma factor [Agitococcus sp.]
MTISDITSGASALPKKALTATALTMDDVAKALIEHRPKMVAVISKLEKNRDTIEDILSITSVKALTSGIAQFEGACSFSTYLCNIAYHEAVTHVSKQVNRKTGTKIFYDHEIGTGADNLEAGALIDASGLELNGPEYTLEKRQDLSNVKVVLERLERQYPSAYKAWSMFRLEERSFAEIHELTGESLSTVRRHVTRVSEQLEMLSDRPHN